MSDTPITELTPTAEQAIEYAHDIRSVADCWVDRCLLVLVAEIAALQSEVAYANSKNDTHEAMLRGAVARYSKWRAMADKLATELENLACGGDVEARDALTEYRALDAAKGETKS